MRNEYTVDQEFQSAVGRLLPNSQIERGTRFILRELICPFLVNTHIQISRNHTIDFLHAVVPIAYCDFVLLDKHWRTQVEHARARLNAAGLSAPIAKVFSGRSNELDHFLCELESES